MPGEHGEQPGAQGSTAGTPDVVAEESLPVRHVTLLRLGDPEENLALLPRAPTSKAAIDGGFGVFVGEPTPPPTHRG